ncbi:MAG TPA: hypothetical protein VJC17_00255, partial [Candidatus Dojkabacteria bacterium]|nr:hypothetical protein [Candidatus Dojkabacteria bacterium]
YLLVEPEHREGHIGLFGLPDDTNSIVYRFLVNEIKGAALIIETEEPLNRVVCPCGGFVKPYWGPYGFGEP